MTEPVAASPLGMESQRSWSMHSALIALLIVAAVMLWPTVSTLVSEWEDTANLTYTHGYLIALVSAWLLWRARPLAQDVRVEPEPRMLLGVAALSFAWLLSYRSNIEIAHQILLPLLGWCAIYAAFGWQVARRCAFAFGFFYFAVPIWSFGNEALQSLTVITVRVMLQLTGIPAYVTGNLVHIPSGVFEIAGGCSGLHFFIVALAIGSLYGEIHKDTWRVRLATVVFAMALSMITNWIRVFTLIVLGHATQMQHHLVSVEHYTFGWVLFAGSMLVFFFFARYLPTAAERDERKARAIDSERSVFPVPILLAAVVALGIGPAWLALAPAVASQPVQEGALPSLAGWEGPSDSNALDWAPVFEGADSNTLAEYRNTTSRVQVFVAAYHEQHQGKELVGYANSMLGDLGTGAAVTYELLQAEDDVFNSSRLTTRDGRHALVVHYYAVGRQRTVNARTAQLLYGWQSLVSIPISKAIGAYAVCKSDCSTEQVELLDLLTRISGSMD